jgi:hypothetical protein
MEMMRKTLLYIMAGLTFGHLPTGAAPLVAQGDCKPVLDAANKTSTTPLTRTRQ